MNGFQAKTNQTLTVRIYNVKYNIEQIISRSALYMQYVLALSAPLLKLEITLPEFDSTKAPARGSYKSTNFTGKYLLPYIHP
jgi:hypothetical protein